MKPRLTHHWLHRRQCIPLTSNLEGKQITKLQNLEHNDRRQCDKRDNHADGEQFHRVPPKSLKFFTAEIVLAFSFLPCLNRLAGALILRFAFSALLRLRSRNLFLFGFPDL